MLDIFKEILKALEHEDRVMLATIISTSGSTPASALSKMLVKDNCTSLVGTVGGGCMEADVAEHARIIYPQKVAKIISYRLTEDGIEQGLICGGTLNILIEPLTKENIPLINKLRELCDDGEDTVLATILLNDGKKVEKAIINHPDSQIPIQSHDIFISIKDLADRVGIPEKELDEIISKVNKRNETERVTLPNGELILEPMPGKPSLIIFGGGHVSKYVSRTASMTGFSVTIVDDRDLFANPKRFPEAKKTIAVKFDEVFNHITVKPSTYIVIVTRGHRYDEVVLEQAIKTPAKYIGMIGSKRKVFTTYRHLVERGVSADALKRVYAPMGIDVGAVTAEEIAVSIVSEMIKVRRSSSRELAYKSDGMKPLFTKLEQENIET